MPRPLKGCSAIKRSRRCSAIFEYVADIGAVRVSIGCRLSACDEFWWRGHSHPGQMALTWIRYGAQSRATAFVIAATAPFEAQIDTADSIPTRPRMEPMLMIDPRSPSGVGSCTRICADANLQPRNTPLVFIRCITSNTSSSAAHIGLGSDASIAVPALLTNLLRPEVSWRDPSACVLVVQRTCPHGRIPPQSSRSSSAYPR